MILCYIKILWVFFNIILNFLYQERWNSSLSYIIFHCPKYLIFPWKRNIKKKALWIKIKSNHKSWQILVSYVLIWSFIWNVSKLYQKCIKTVFNMYNNYTSKVNLSYIICISAQACFHQQICTHVYLSDKSTG